MRSLALVCAGVGSGTAELNLIVVSIFPELSVPPFTELLVVSVLGLASTIDLVAAVRDCLSRRASVLSSALGFVLSDV